MNSAKEKSQWRGRGSEGGIDPPPLYTRQKVGYRLTVVGRVGEKGAADWLQICTRDESNSPGFYNILLSISSNSLFLCLILAPLIYLSIYWHPQGMGWDTKKQKEKENKRE